MIAKRALLCSCGSVVWDILGGGFKNGQWKLSGEVDRDVVMPHIDADAIFGNQCATIKVARVTHNGNLVKIRLRDTFAVFKRNHCCVACGEPGVKWLLIQRPTLAGNVRAFNITLVTKDYVPMTLDHKVPKSRGGPNHIDNFQTMCWSCNNDKGHLPHDEYMKAFHDGREQSVAGEARLGSRVRISEGDPAHGDGVVCDPMGG